MQKVKTNCEALIEGYSDKGTTMKLRDSKLITWAVVISILCLVFAANGQEPSDLVEKETERSISESLLSPSVVDDGFALSMMHTQEEESDLEPRRGSLITIRPQVWFPEPDGIIILQDVNVLTIRYTDKENPLTRRQKPDHQP